MRRISWRKHWLSYLLVIAGMFTLTACGATSLGANAQGTQAPAPTNTKPGNTGNIISSLPSNACSLVTTAQMQQITGTAYLPFSPATYPPPGGATGAMVCQTSTADHSMLADYVIFLFPSVASASSYYTREKGFITQKEGSITDIAGVGDQAFAGAHDPLFAVKSNVALQVLVGSTSVYADQNAEKQVAALVFAGL